MYPSPPLYNATITANRVLKKSDTSLPRPLFCCLFVYQTVFKSNLSVSEVHMHMYFYYFKNKCIHKIPLLEYSIRQIIFGLVVLTTAI